jgi:predicted negative regulator of RcsB-dependent stress response
MAKKISRKELLKQPDQFLSSTDKAMLFFTNNRSTVISSIVAVLVGGFSLFGYQNYQQSQTMKFEAMYFNMEEIVKVEEAKGNNPESQLVKIRDQISDESHRNRASLLLADVYFQYENFDKAKSTYQKIRNSSDGLNQQMANVGLAYTHEAMGEFKKAIDLFKLVIDTNDNFPLFQVYWSLARCHENNKDTSNALLILREMQIKFSGRAELEKIENQIKQLSA